MRELLSRPDIDDVVIIISRRARLLPNTSLALAPELARDVWLLYLGTEPRVRIEIAPHTAIAHALGWIDRASPGDQLRFCLGEEDFAAGDPRFAAIETARSRGIDATVVAAATGRIKVRATQLRDALLRGSEGRQRFIELLPSGLDPQVREAVWQRCRQGLEPVEAIFARRLRELLPARCAIVPQALKPLSPGRVDPVYRLHDADGRRLVARYAGDTVSDETFDDPARPKPRRRLRAAQLALQHVAKLRASGLPRAVQVPAVVAFDSATRTLVTTEVMPGSPSLAEIPGAGAASALHGRALGAWLAALHGAPPPPDGFWSGDIGDGPRWIELREGLLQRAVARLVRHDAMQALAERHRNADLPIGVIHGQLCAAHILIAGNDLGLIDFERAVTRGDAAFDLGKVLALGLARCGLRAFADAMLRAYLEASPPTGRCQIATRSLEYAIADLASDQESDTDRTDGRELARRLLALPAERVARWSGQPALDALVHG